MEGTPLNSKSRTPNQAPSLAARPRQPFQARSGADLAAISSRVAPPCSARYRLAFSFSGAGGAQAQNQESQDIRSGRRGQLGGHHHPQQYGIPAEYFRSHSQPAARVDPSRGSDSRPQGDRMLTSKQGIQQEDPSRAKELTPQEQLQMQQYLSYYQNQYDYGYQQGAPQQYGEEYDRYYEDEYYQRGNQYADYYGQSADDYNEAFQYYYYQQWLQQQQQQSQVQQPQTPSAARAQNSQASQLQPSAPARSASAPNERRDLQGLHQRQGLGSRQENSSFVNAQAQNPQSQNYDTYQHEAGRQQDYQRYYNEDPRYYEGQYTQEEMALMQRYMASQQDQFMDPYAGAGGAYDQRLSQYLLQQQQHQSQQPAQNRRGSRSAFLQRYNQYNYGQDYAQGQLQAHYGQLQFANQKSQGRSGRNPQVMEQQQMAYYRNAGQDYYNANYFNSRQKRGPGKNSAKRLPKVDAVKTEEDQTPKSRGKCPKTEIPEQEGEQAQEEPVDDEVQRKDSSRPELKQSNRDGLKQKLPEEIQANPEAQDSHHVDERAEPAPPQLAEQAAEVDEVDAVMQEPKPIEDNGPSELQAKLDELIPDARTTSTKKEKQQKLEKNYEGLVESSQVELPPKQPKKRGRKAKPKEPTGLAPQQAEVVEASLLPSQLPERESKMIPDGYSAKENPGGHPSKVENSLADLLAPPKDPVRQEQFALLTELIPQYLKIRATDNLTLAVQQLLASDDIISPAKRGRPHKREGISKKEKPLKVETTKDDLQEAAAHQFESPIKISVPAEAQSPLQSMATQTSHMGHSPKRQTRSSKARPLPITPKNTAATALEQPGTESKVEEKYSTPVKQLFNLRKTSFESKQRTAEKEDVSMKESPCKIELMPPTPEKDQQLMDQLAINEFYGTPQIGKFFQTKQRHLRKELTSSPLSLEKCYDFLKLFEENEKWIKTLACSQPSLMNTQQEKHLRNCKSLHNLENMFIPQGTKVYLISKKWASGIKDYLPNLIALHKTKIKQEQELESLEEQSAIEAANLAGSKKSSKLQKKQLQIAHQQTMQQVKSKKSDITDSCNEMTRLGQAFVRTSSLLDNSDLLLPSHPLSAYIGFPEGENLEHKLVKSLDDHDLNSYLKPVLPMTKEKFLASLPRISNEKQSQLEDILSYCIAWEEDFIIVRPDFHAFIKENRQHLFVSQDSFQPILRRFLKDDLTIRSSLEFNFCPIKVTVKNLEPMTFSLQMPKAATFYQCKQRINQLIQDNFIAPDSAGRKKKAKKSSSTSLKLKQEFNLNDYHFEVKKVSLLEAGEEDDEANEAIANLIEQFNDKDIYIFKLLDCSMKRSGSPTERLSQLLDFITSEVQITLEKKEVSEGIIKKQVQLKSMQIIPCNYCRYFPKRGPSMIVCKCQRVQYCSLKCQQMDDKFHLMDCIQQIDKLEDWHCLNRTSAFRKVRGGITGLLNLTNSCYMNCTIQCLSHCKALTNYFLQGCFIDEINTQNPLGAQGLISIAYAKLVKDLWVGNQPTVIPYNFKNVVARFKKQFANQEQQDSLELLNIILDSLHEDLNRIKVKPLVPMIESHGEDDEKASIESWEAHLKRSQSIIVDLMHGQFKSTVRCPEVDCNHLSITFEAFMNISLPIPEIKLVTAQFVWVPLDIRKRCSIHSFTIKGHESIANLRRFLTQEVLSKHELCDNEDGFEIVQLYNDQIKRILCKPNQAIGLQSPDLHLFCYEIAPEALLQKEEKDEDSDTGDDLNLTVQSEWADRMSKSIVMAPLNITVVDYEKESQSSKTGESSRTTYFPRLVYFDAKSSLIDVHLTLFSHVRFIFARVLELREERALGQLKEHGASMEEQLLAQKLSLGIPLHITLEKWNAMSLTEQYEVVFSSSSSSARNPSSNATYKYGSQSSFPDPSRRKPEELPYFVRVVTCKAKGDRPGLDGEADALSGSGSPDMSKLASPLKRGKKAKAKKEPQQSPEIPQSKCTFCMRKHCEGCPLPFDDRLSLKAFLERSKVPAEPASLLKEDDEFNYKELAQKIKLQKKQAEEIQLQKGQAPPGQASQHVTKSGGKSESNKKQPKGGIKEPEKKKNEQDEQEVGFQLVIEFNRNTCWGLHELLVRGQNQMKTFVSYLQLKKAQDQVQMTNGGPLKREKKFFINKVTIADCFRQFNRPEKLSWQNEWYCDRCKAHKQAVKRIQVFKLPPVLIITLKRFKGHLQNQKQNTPVYYPVEGLNMKHFMIRRKALEESGDDSEFKYNLFGVVLHTGNLSGGHYTALAKNKNHWYEFNDSQVLQLSQREVQTKVVSNHAYILFYQRQGIDFDNISDYELIKNKLVQVPLLAQGSQGQGFNGAQEQESSEARFVEKFLPDNIRFPLLQHDLEDDVMTQVQSTAPRNQEELSVKEAYSLSKDEIPFTASGSRQAPFEKFRSEGQLETAPIAQGTEKKRSRFDTAQHLELPGQLQEESESGPHLDQVAASENYETLLPAKRPLPEALKVVIDLAPKKRRELPRLAEPQTAEAAAQDPVESECKKLVVCFSIKQGSQEAAPDHSMMFTDISGLSCIDSEIDDLLRCDIDSQVAELNLPKKRVRKLKDKTCAGSNPAKHLIINQFQRDLINLQIAMNQNKRHVEGAQSPPPVTPPKVASPVVAPQVAPRPVPQHSLERPTKAQKQGALKKSSRPPKKLFRIQRVVRRPPAPPS